MDLHSRNGNGGATIPPATVIPVVSGVGLANRKLNKVQRAILAAGVHDGSVRFEPSITQLAALFGVSSTYILQARKLDHLQLQHAIMEGGRNRKPLAEILPPRATKLPVITEEVLIDSKVSDNDLEDLIRDVGVERVLDAAVRVER